MQSYCRQAYLSMRPGQAPITDTSILTSTHFRIRSHHPSHTCLHRWNGDVGDSTSDLSQLDQKGLRYDSNIARTTADSLVFSPCHRANSKIDNCSPLLLASSTTTWCRTKPSWSLLQLAEANVDVRVPLTLLVIRDYQR